MKTSLAQEIRTLETLRQIQGIRVGKIVKIDERGQVFIDYADNQQGPIVARFTRSVDIESLRYAENNHVKILLAFENNDPKLPIIVDMISSLIDNIADDNNAPIEIEKPDDIFVDGKRVTFDAKEEIVLRCGKASITLTKAGKVLIRGAYLLSRSSGVNRIKGGSVQLN
jgi:Domain of unknown function (DUF6484)